MYSRETDKPRIGRILYFLIYNENDCFKCNRAGRAVQIALCDKHYLDTSRLLLGSFT